MQYQKTKEPTPVGVVPRRQAQSIEPLMSDAPKSGVVTEEIESPPPGRPSQLSQWLSAATTFGVVAAALEWLKLTR